MGSLIAITLALTQASGTEGIPGPMSWSQDALGSGCHSDFGLGHQECLQRRRYRHVPIALVGPFQAWSFRRDFSTVGDHRIASARPGQPWLWFCPLPRPLSGLEGETISSSWRVWARCWTERFGVIGLFPISDNYTVINRNGLSSFSPRENSNPLCDPGNDLSGSCWLLGRHSWVARGSCIHTDRCSCGPVSS